MFVSPRERRMLSAIERATRHKIEPLELPSTEMVNNKRIADFKQKISDTLAAGELEFMQGIMEQYEQEHDVSPLEIAAALAKMSIGDRSLLLKPESRKPAREKARVPRDRGETDGRLRRRSKSQAKADPPQGMERYRIAVGHKHDVQPGNIVGAIAGEAGLDGEHIGHIDIHDDFSFVDLPLGMPKDIFQDLKKTWVCGQKLNITRVNETKPAQRNPKRESAKRESAKKLKKKPKKKDKKTRKDT